MRRHCSDDLARSSTAILTTFRSSGEGVATPVSIALVDGLVYFATAAGSGKAKRLARSDRVTVAPSTVGGVALGAPVSGRARLLEGRWPGRRPAPVAPMARAVLELPDLPGPRQQHESLRRRPGPDTMINNGACAVVVRTVTLEPARARTRSSARSSRERPPIHPARTGQPEVRGSQPPGAGQLDVQQVLEARPARDRRDPEVAVRGHCGRAVAERHPPTGVEHRLHRHGCGPAAGETHLREPPADLPTVGQALEDLTRRPVDHDPVDDRQWRAAAGGPLQLMHTHRCTSATGRTASGAAPVGTG